MRRPLTAALVALAVVSAGCGSATPTPRARLATYLKDVNRVERELVKPLRTVTQTASQFASEQRRGSGTSSSALGNLVDVSHEGALLAANRQIATVRVRLAALQAPPAAHHLRSMLIELVDQQATITAQTAQLVMFLPQFAQAMQPLGPAITRLESVLSLGGVSGTAAVQALYARKAQALRRFQATLHGMLSRLGRLAPPPASGPEYRAQLRALGGMASTAGRLAGMLERNQTSGIPALLAAFDRAATGPQSLTTQRAQIAAIRAYDAQVGRLTSLAESAQRERLRLASAVR